jgi:hypothetical protein
MFNDSTADACCDRCEGDDRCGFWTFRDAAKTSLNAGCALKPSGEAQMRDDPVCTSGFGPAPSPRPPSPATPTPPPPAVPTPPPTPPPAPTPPPPIDPTRPTLLPGDDVRVSAPLYWCTWQAQGRAWMSAAAGLNHSAALRFWEARTHEGWMEGSSSRNLFTNGTATSGGGVGWAWSAPPAARRELFLLLDNGWQEGDESTSRDLVLNASRFPEFVVTPPDATRSLALLRQRVQELGWRGLGVWVNGGGVVSAAGFARLHAAGVGVLKFDGGDGGCRMTSLAAQYAPGLVVEHGRCVNGCPLNGGAQGEAAVESAADATAQAKQMGCSDSFRSYDTVRVESIAETLDRQTRLLQVAAALNGSTLRHFGGSGEITVTASLGGTIQPMRSALPQLPAEFSNYADGPRDRQERIDEVSRLVSWARIAPPFGGGLQRLNSVPDQLVTSSADYLNDSWTFAEADDAAVIGHKLQGLAVVQAAPARSARGGLVLPVVTMPAADGSGRSRQPFVVSTRFPTGPISITSIGRTAPGAFVEAEDANVTQALGEPPSATTVVGVFGYFGELVLAFSAAQALAPVPVFDVWAQDLVGTTPARNVTGEVRWADGGASLVLPGAIITQVGQEGRSRAGDVSPPGLVVRLAPHS